MQSQTTIRPPEEKDLLDIQSIYALYYLDPKDVEHLGNRVKQSITQAPEAVESNLHYLVAKIDGKVVGLIGFRKPLQKLLSFVKTSNPVELYTLFVSTKQHGIGRVLVEKMTEIVTKSGHTEIVVYSSDLWKESWPFYDKIGFERVGMLTYDNGGSGQVWRRELK